MKVQDGGETWQSWLPKPPAGGEGSKLEIDDFGGVYLFSGYGYYRGINSADWTTLGGPIPNGIITGVLWRGTTPFIVAARSDGLYRLNLPPIQKLWLPVVRN